MPPPRPLPTLCRLSLAAILVLLPACGTATERDGGATSMPAPASAVRARHLAVAPPVTKTVDVVDDFHGSKVPDPYRWLEDLDAPEAREWVDAQNRATEAFLQALPQRDRIAERLTELWSYARRSPPSRHGGIWAYTKNDGLQNHAVLCVTSDPAEPGRVLLDPNTLSEDGTAALSGAAFSEDGAWLAFAVSRRGSDWQEWKIMEVATGQLLPETLQWVKFTRAAWAKDGSGFFYQRYPAPAEGEAYEAVNQQPQLCWHRRGTPQTEDQVIYERPDQPRWSFGPQVSEDGRYLVVHAREGTDTRNRVLYMDLHDREAGVRPLLMEFDASYSFLGNDGAWMWFETDDHAPNKRIVAVHLEQPQPEHWREVVAERQEPLQSARMIADRFVLTYMRDAHHVVRVVGRDGKLERELPVPPLSSVTGMTGERDDTVTYFGVTTFTQPTSIVRYDFAAGRDEVEPYWQPELRFDPAAFEQKQVFLQSADGTRLPMFLVHRKGLALDGSHPTLLFGYGGFDISLLPSFDVARIAWLELGGVYAQPTLRGGGEYGQRWHQAGMLERKQNVFEDFYAAARYLVRNDYTRPERLGIGGRSNGGLLVGAALTQHPELFGAAVPEVGVMDMLRYHRFTIGWGWAPEYGRADDPAMFPVLHAYSPLHNVRPGTAYPPTLVMTGDHDDRVLPAHSYKFAAALQAAQSGSAPVLLRVDTSAGHGAGKPVRKLIQAEADRLAFLAWALGAGDA